MVNEQRLIKPSDDFASAFPELHFENNFNVRSSEDGVLVCDPVILGDVYNSDDEISSYLRHHGAFLMDFGGDISCPIWFKYPFVLMPASLYFSKEKIKAPDGVEVLAEEIGTDSGSFIFLPILSDAPPILATAIKEEIKKGSAVILPIASGVWSLFYEQLDPPQESVVGLYRNIVLKYEGAPNNLVEDALVGSDLVDAARLLGRSPGR